MDTPALPSDLMHDGETYLAALDLLGLRPAACFWAYDRQLGEFVLVLVADEFDSVGPLGLSRQLFKAFRAGATPRTIDPFKIRLHSPRHTIIREIERARLRSMAHVGADTAVHAPRSVIAVDALEVDSDWIFRFDKPLYDAPADPQVMQRWQVFEKAVESAAA